MIERLRARLTGTALGPVLVVWTMGYGLIAILTSLLGRTGAALSFVTELPLLVFGVTLTMALERLHRGLAQRSRLLRWPAMALAVVAATFVQTFGDLLSPRWLSIVAFPDWRAWAYDFTLQRTITVL